LKPLTIFVVLLIDDGMRSLMSFVMHLEQQLSMQMGGRFGVKMQLVQSMAGTFESNQHPEHHYSILMVSC